MIGGEILKEQAGFLRAEGFSWRSLNVCSVATATGQGHV